MDNYNMAVPTMQVSELSWKFAIFPCSAQLRSPVSTSLLEPVSYILRFAWRILKKTTPAFLSRSRNLLSHTEKRWARSLTGCVCPSHQTSTIVYTWKPGPCPMVLLKISTRYEEVLVVTKQKCRPYQ